MTFRLRAVRAFALLVGFFLMGAVLLTAMAVLDWLVLTKLYSARAAWVEGGLLTVTFLLAVAILRGMFAFLRAGRLPQVTDAVAVTPEDQPELWEQIRAAAEATGQRPPDELYLVAEVNAGVAEQSRWLGLLPGRRRMFLGLPLLAGVTGAQLRAVLVHEFGHLSNLDTRLGAVTMRGRTALIHTVEAFRDGSTHFHYLVGVLYVGYARMFLRTTQSVARHQELAADRMAARHAGRDATAAALRALPVLMSAYAHYLETYASMGGSQEQEEEAGGAAGAGGAEAAEDALPPVGEVYGGFRRLLAARTEEGLTALAAGQRPPRPHPYDSHPPLAERIALIEELPADVELDPHSHTRHQPTPALALLRDTDHLFAALEARTLPPTVVQLPRKSWDELTMARAIADAEGWSRPLQVAVARTLRSTEQKAEQTTDGTATVRRDTTPSVPASPASPAGAVSTVNSSLPGLEEILDAFDRGLLWMEVADRMPKPYQAARLIGPSARNFIRPRIFDGLAGLIHLRLAESGQAQPDIAWSGRPGLVLPDAWEKGMDDALDAAVADTPDTAPLRALLATPHPLATAT
ncbi:M48 family metallopeptidase [Streptomyces sp. NPDC051913]|uniref:M48 family metallopeptidase n=1 Tax=Streptomyces sp. NPDC051913 TaxID=3365676 RepID=UPI0037CF3665